MLKGDTAKSRLLLCFQAGKENIMKAIKKFFNMTGKQMLICTVAVVFTMILGVTAQFISLFAFSMMANGVYTLVKSPVAFKNNKAVALTLVIGCSLIGITAGWAIYVIAGKATLCGSSAGLFGAFVLKEVG